MENFIIFWDDGGLQYIYYLIPKVYNLGNIKNVYFSILSEVIK